MVSSYGFKVITRKNTKPTKKTNENIISKCAAPFLLNIELKQNSNLLTYPKNKAFAPVVINNVIVNKINECLKPFRILPSEILPITNPAKKD